MHPNIWLTPSLITTLKAKASAGNSDWLTLKASADQLVTKAVNPFAVDVGGDSTHIGYGYHGSEWLDAIQTLGLAYRITGNAAYAQKAIAVMNAANAATQAGDLRPVSIDSGFPSRMVALALAVGFDWTYDQMDATTKAQTITTLNAWYDWFKASALDNTGPALSNYFGGHLLGFGTAGLATAGDNARSGEITTYMRQLFDSQIGAAFNGGAFAGGFPWEGYVYGTNHFVRILQYMQAVKTATGEDIYSTSDYAQKIARNLIYNRKPNRWQATDEADYAGDYTALFPHTLPAILTGFLSGKTEGGWMQSFLQTFAPDPTNSGQLGPDPVSNFLLADPSVAPIDYRTTLPPYFHSLGDEHFYARSSWQDDAVFATFRAGSTHLAGHQLKNAGHFSLQRGNDYFLVNSGQWRGTDGVSGRPIGFDDTGWRSNSLFVDDLGDYLFTGTDYVGGQGSWGTDQVLASELNSDHVYAKGDLTTAYTVGDYKPFAQRSVLYFIRSFVTMGNNYVTLMDRVRVTKPTYIKKLYFHFNPNGIPAVSGSRITSIVGNSTLYMTALLPAAPAITVAPEPVSTTDATTLTYRAEVTDSVTGTDLISLQVLQASAKGTAAVPAILIQAGNAVAAHIKDPAGDNVIVFSADPGGATMALPVTYTMTPVAATRRHLVTELPPSTAVKLSITDSGSSRVITIASGGTAGGTSYTTSSQGTLAFTDTGTGTPPPPPPTNACDLNGDGTSNVIDVQLEVNMALGLSLCTGDINKDSQCNVIDVQRVVNAALGGQCVSP